MEHKFDIVVVRYKKFIQMFNIWKDHGKGYELAQANCNLWQWGWNKVLK